MEAFFSGGDSDDGFVHSFAELGQGPRSPVWLACVTELFEKSVGDAVEKGLRRRTGQSEAIDFVEYGAEAESLDLCAIAYSGCSFFGNVRALEVGKHRQS